MNRREIYKFPAELITAAPGAGGGGAAAATQKLKS